MSGWGIELASRKRLVIAVAGISLAIIGGLIVSLQQSKSAASLLPQPIVQQIHGFTPYFYRSKVPSGYIFNGDQVIYDKGVLIITLVGSKSTITMSQQAMTEQLAHQKLFDGNNFLTDTQGKAEVKIIDQRLVGTMVSTDKKTLILLHSSAATDRNDMVQLLRGLQPVK